MLQHHWTGFAGAGLLVMLIQHLQGGCNLDLAQPGHGMPVPQLTVHCVEECRQMVVQALGSTAMTSKPMQLGQNEQGGSGT